MSPIYNYYAIKVHIFNPWQILKLALDFKLTPLWSISHLDTILNFCLQVDRTGTKVTVVEQKVKKDYTFHKNLLDLCVECLERGVVPNPEVQTL